MFSTQWTNLWLLWGDCLLFCFRLSRNWRQKAWKESLIALKQHKHWRRRWTSYLIIWRRKTSRTQSSKQPEFKEPMTPPGGAPAWLRSSQVPGTLPLWSCSYLLTLCPRPSLSYFIHMWSRSLWWHLSSQNRHTQNECFQIDIFYYIG